MHTGNRITRSFQGLRFTIRVGNVGNDKDAAPSEDKEQARFLILYVTCEDLDLSAVRSCESQDYPTDLFRVVVCDDSAASQAKRLKKHNVTYVRNPAPNGLKSGNINNALSRDKLDSIDWIIIIDADQHVPKDFLLESDKILSNVDERVGMAQFQNVPMNVEVDADQGATWFEEHFQLITTITYGFAIPPRAAFGFLPFMGHGCAIRGACWNDLTAHAPKENPMPDYVAEDFAFAIKAAPDWNRIYVKDILLFERFPRDLGAYIVHRKKLLSGAWELIPLVVRSWWNKTLSRVATVDLLAIVLGYFLEALSCVAIVLSVFATAFIWQSGWPPIPAEVATVFLLMLVLTGCVGAAPSGSVVRGLLFWIRCASIHMVVHPFLLVELGRLLIRRTPKFYRTPKGSGATMLDDGTAWAITLAGVIIVQSSLSYWSPFSWFGIALGCAWITAIPMTWCNQRSGMKGKLGRAAVLTPGTLLIIGICEMWHWCVFGGSFYQFLCSEFFD